MGRSKRERNIKNNELNSKFMSEVKNGKLAYSIPILVNSIDSLQIPVKFQLMFPRLTFQKVQPKERKA